MKKPRKTVTFFSGKFNFFYNGNLFFNEECKNTRCEPILLFLQFTIGLDLLITTFPRQYFLQVQQ